MRGSLIKHTWRLLMMLGLGFAFQVGGCGLTQTLGEQPATQLNSIGQALTGFVPDFLRQLLAAGLL
ncbi:MAG: hypothetical protein V2A79_13680 [Planctomycetota bacterium]